MLSAADAGTALPPGTSTVFERSHARVRLPAERLPSMPRRCCSRRSKLPLDGSLPPRRRAKVRWLAAGNGEAMPKFPLLCRVLQVRVRLAGFVGVSLPNGNPVPLGATVERRQQVDGGTRLFCCSLLLPDNACQ